MSTKKARDDLLLELERDANDCFKGGRLNNVVDIALTILTVGASLAATVLTAVHVHGDVSKWVIAGVAALPAAATSLQRIVAMRERSNWYFAHAAYVRALAIELKHTNADVADIAKRRANFEVEMEASWSKIGMGGAEPRRRVHKKP
jgi:hypothetical protein